MPHAPVFLSKSAEAIENKKVAFLKSAKKCKKEQKTAQEHANKGDRCWGIGVRERTIAMKRRSPYPPTILHEYQKKRLTKIAFRN
jgi:hypothetical protein